MSWRWPIVLNHTPTGITVKVDFLAGTNNIRSQYQAKQMAIKILKSRMKAMDMELQENAFDYVLPDELTHPHEIEDYKECTTTN